MHNKLQHHDFRNLAYMFIRGFTIWLIGFTCAYAQNNSMQWVPVHEAQSPVGIITTYIPEFHEIPYYGYQMKQLTRNDKTYRFASPGAETLPIPVLQHAYKPPEAESFLKLMPQGWDSDICYIRPFWYVIQDKAIPVWSVRTCPSGMMGNREMIWSPQDNAVLDSLSHLAHFTSDTTARALVFTPDPLTKAGAYYTAPFSDQQDADIPELNAQRDTVIIHIVFENDSFRLKGPWVEIKDIELPNNKPVVQKDRDFFFTRSLQGFEEVNALYHIQKFQMYIRNIGFLDLCDFPLAVDAHGVQGADNSYFSPDMPPNGSFLSFGEGGVDDAEDADVIVHEYIHALSHCAAPESNLGAERRGLDEGMGDYFAAAMSYDYDNFRWADIYTWDGHNEFWAGRRTDVEAVYPLSNPNIYQNGSLWATAMMANRFDIGTAADQLQLQAMYFNVQNNTLRDAARNILIADTLLFNGIHTPQLIWNFCRYGFLTGAACAFLTQQMPNAPDIKPAVYPNPAHKEACLMHCPADWQLFNATGQEVLRGNTPCMLLQDLNPGLYFIRFPDTQQHLKLRVEP